MSLLQQNTIRWQNCHVKNMPAFQAVADKIKTNKSVYDEIEAATGVPWWFIGVCHYREANLNMNANLAQGDPWNRVSTHVPKGRGPFKSFKDAAIDALTKCPPYAAKNKDWTPGGAMTMFEKYNGLGYANQGLPSPYVWAGTDQYVKGKYIADGVYSPTAVDKQLGCAGIVKALGVYKDNTAFTAGAGAVVTCGTAMAATPVHYWPYILGGAAFIAAVGITAYYSYKLFKGK